MTTKLKSQDKKLIEELIKIEAQLTKLKKEVANQDIEPDLRADLIKIIKSLSNMIDIYHWRV